MIFIDNKYTKIYYSIVNSARLNEISNEYIEKHHIVPVSLGGSNEKQNLVRLTARQHFICHWLLTKMTEGDNKKKMIFALNRMTTLSPNQQRYIITGRKYELIKREYNKINPFNDKEWQASQREKNHIGKTRSNETKQKLKEAWAKNKENRVGVNHPRYGKDVSIDTRKKLSKAMKGKLLSEKNPMYGKTHTLEVKKLLSDRLLNNPMPKKFLECKYCHRIIDAGNFKRWHGSKCKLKN